LPANNARITFDVWQESYVIRAQGGVAYAPAIPSDYGPYLTAHATPMDKPVSFRHLRLIVELDANPSAHAPWPRRLAPSATSEHREIWKSAELPQCPASPGP
jgi:hypothetical protein